MRDYSAILQRVSQRLQEISLMKGKLEYLESDLIRRIRNLNSFSDIGVGALGTTVTVGNREPIRLNSETCSQVKTILVDQQAKLCDQTVDELEKVSPGITGVPDDKAEGRVLEL